MRDNLIQKNNTPDLAQAVTANITIRQDNSDLKIIDMKQSGSKIKFITGRNAHTVKQGTKDSSYADPIRISRYQHPSCESLQGGSYSSRSRSKENNIRIIESQRIQWIKGGTSDEDSQIKTDYTQNWHQKT